MKGLLYRNAQKTIAKGSLVRCGVTARTLIGDECGKKVFMFVRDCKKQKDDAINGEKAEQRHQAELDLEKLAKKLFLSLGKMTTAY